MLVSPTPVPSTQSLDNAHEQTTNQVFVQRAFIRHSRSALPSLDFFDVVKLLVERNARCVSQAGLPGISLSKTEAHT